MAAFEQALQHLIVAIGEHQQKNNRESGE